MSLPRELPSKKEVALMLLESSDVFIHLDPRKEQVVVPPWLRKQPHLILQVGLNMPVAIPDLDVGEDGVSCTLSFNRSPFWCKLPWTAVYALVSKDARGMVWPDDVPPEVAVKFVKQEGAAPEAPVQPVAAAAPVVAPEPVPEAQPPARGKGRKSAGRKKRAPAKQAEAAAAGAPSAAEAAAQQPAARSKRELPPYLRVIK
jgi:hypothetical protein